MNAIAHALAVNPSDVIASEHLPEAQAPVFAASVEPARSGPASATTSVRGRTSTPPPPGLDAKSLTLRAELEDLLHKHDGNISRIADATGWNRTWLYKLLDRLQLDPKDYRPED
jgi:DNA-binding NtrC family response regulator